MAVIAWIIVALGLVAGAVALAARHAASLAPARVVPPGEKVPVTSTQRLVGWSLALGLIPAVAAGALVAWFGPDVYWDDDAVRLTVTGLVLASMFILVAPQALASLWAAHDDRRIDERDRGILAQAPTSQAAAMLVVLAIWVVALTESFRGEAGIPRVYMYLAFWSYLLVSLLAWNVGALLGYRRT